jgi:hypothetical protein
VDPRRRAAPPLGRGELGRVQRSADRDRAVDASRQERRGAGRAEFDRLRRVEVAAAGGTSRGHRLRRLRAVDPDLDLVRRDRPANVEQHGQDGRRVQRRTGRVDLRLRGVAGQVAAREIAGVDLQRSASREGGDLRDDLRRVDAGQR